MPLACDCKDLGERFVFEFLVAVICLLSAE